MKKIIIHTAIIILIMINTAASCDSDSEDPKPKDTFSLIGKWQLTDYVMEQTQTDGTIKSSTWKAKDKNVKIVWEFKDNGEYIATEQNEQVKGTWDLKVERVNSTDPSLIDKGFLTIKVPSKTLNFDVNMDKYFVQDNRKTTLVCFVDVTEESGTGLKTVIWYTYERI